MIKLRRNKRFSDSILGYVIIIIVSCAVIFLTSCGGSSEKKTRITGIKTDRGTLVIIEHDKE
jgi:hypothetical protein